jgi:hypothetical protein
MTSEPASQKARCDVQDYRIGHPKAGDVEYVRMRGATHTLQPSQMRLGLTNVKPGTRVLTLPKTALPFGLLDTITLIGMPASMPPITLRVIKSTGIAECSLTGPRWRCQVGVGNSTLFTAQDAADADLKLVRDTTGHCMTWRMLSGSSIGDMTFNFAEAPPASFIVVFGGANAVDIASSTPEKPKLLLPPLSPALRLSGLESVTSQLLKK